MPTMAASFDPALFIGRPVKELDAALKLHLERKRPAASDKPAPPQPAWLEGVHVVSESEPRIVIYPNFLSAEEAAYLHDLSRWGALEAELRAIKEFSMTR